MDEVDKIEQATRTFESLMDEMGHEIRVITEKIIAINIQRDAYKQCIVELKDQIKEMRGKG